MKEDLNPGPPNIFKLNTALIHNFLKNLVKTHNLTKKDIPLKPTSNLFISSFLTIKIFLLNKLDLIKRMHS